MTRRAFLAVSAATLFGAMGARSPRRYPAFAQPSFPLLVSTDTLLSRVADADPDLVLLDASPLRAYRRSHIPRSRHVYWEDTIDREYPVYGAVVTQGFEQRFRLEVVGRWSVTPADDVVVYDDGIGYRAARIVWFLRFLGFPRVALLDGGMAGWRAIDGAIESGVEDAPGDEKPAIDPQEGYYLVSDQVAERLDQSGVTPLDTRTFEEQHDDLAGQLPLGMIPGSLHLPWTGLVEPDGRRLRTRADTLRRLQSLGIEPDSEVIVYARFGVDAALTWLALRHAGFERAIVYDRGWAEWAVRDDLPRDPLV
jgi:thiosulfate/3-mercaptopyruvate sulfurtransferase